MLCTESQDRIAKKTVEGGDCENCNLSKNQVLHAELTQVIANTFARFTALAIKH